MLDTLNTALTPIFIRNNRQKKTVFTNRLVILTVDLILKLFGLFQWKCDPWKQYSCCTEQTSVSAHGLPNHYKFNYNHCPNRPMSEKCQKHFIQDLCFYECEPFVKPWVVKTNRSFARERIFKVPICASDCQLWWSDCKDDYTCVYNWARGFQWNNSSNVCPPKAECKTIKEVYRNAQDFCEKAF